MKKFLELFKRKPTELEILLMDFLKGGGMKKFAEYSQEALSKQKEFERKMRIIERYHFFLYAIDNNILLSDQDKKEFDFVSYLVENEFEKNEK
jgi:hypothetical protein